MDQTPVLIAGQPFTSDQGVEVVNPYSGDVVGEVPLCGPAEVDRACTHAREVLRRDDLPLHRRAAILDEASRLVRERSEDLARTIAVESGKPLTTSRVEATRCVDTFAFAAAEARHLSGDVIPMSASTSGAGKLGFALRIPAGVVAAISPFNFPLNLVAHKLAPAIAAGCPVVLKPAPQTPLTAIALVALLVDAGLPDDWISVVTDTRAEAAQPLVEHDIPAVVTFTGSVPVGWGIAAAAPKKKVLLELGSNSPLIVEPDADVADVARRMTPAAFGFAGQSCISVQRVLVHRDVHDELVAELAKAAAGLVVGDPLDEATDVGPLIDPVARDRVRSWIDAATAAGASVVTGGVVDEDGLLRPTVVDGLDTDLDLWCKEAFGPVVGVRAYDTIDEAFELANDSDFGLHAGIFTNDLGVALRAVKELDFGGVLVNEVPTFRADQQPYGGVRDAGNTREGPAYAIEEMTSLRFVSFQA
jgi:acyl-CoA reductase-like NAD-dependent aldehyde dehydrogenase